MSALERLGTKEHPLVSDLSKEEARVLKKAFAFDELVYIGGVINTVLTVYILGRTPAFMWVLHCVKVFIYLPWRYVRFTKTNSGLYLIEFCYFVSYYTTAGCILAFLRVFGGIGFGMQQYSTLCLKVGFAFASGGLAFSVIIFRNNFVLHDPDQLTSTFIHLSPTLMFWTLRWGGGLGMDHLQYYWKDMFVMCPSDYVFQRDVLWDSACPASLYDMLIMPAIVYICAWGVPYFILRFLILPRYIAKHKSDNLFHMMTKKANGDTIEGFVTNFPEKFWPLAYMLQHFTFIMLACTFSWVAWHSFWLHTAFIFGLFTLAAKNGASYTFEVFLLRHAQNTLDTITPPELHADCEHASLTSDGSSNSSSD